MNRKRWRYLPFRMTIIMLPCIFHINKPKFTSTQYLGIRYLAKVFCSFVYLKKKNIAPDPKKKSLSRVCSQC